MITVKEAFQTIMQSNFRFGTETIPLEQAVGRVLRESLSADRDFPPYDRVTMDGIAINHAAFAQGKRSFPIQSTQTAGSPPQKLHQPTACIEIMTGAMMPEGTDTIIRYEDFSVETLENGTREAVLQVDEVVWRQNVHFQGEDRKQGDILREPGSWLSPAEISVAAKIGQDQLQVSRLPRIALVSSGDELVEIAATPLPYQIRRSNLYMLQAALREWQIEAQAFHLPDHPDTILAALQDIRDQFDVMILSGGVSKGKADYIPEALEKLGVTKHFHRIAQRPGKPLWYGEIPDQLQVFALPGNPVSTFIGFNRYVRPWLLQSLGAPLPRPAYARLAKEVLFKPDLTYFLQVRLEMDETGVLLAQPIEGHGSGDLANLMDCDGFLELPQGKNHFQAGESYPLIPYRTLRQM